MNTEQFDAEALLARWQDFYLSRIPRRSGIAENYLYYVKRMFLRGVPPIFDLSHLADLLGLDVRALSSMVNSQNSFYRTFSIPKRNGGTRTITAPFPSLRMVQRWILDNILSSVNISPCAHGFTKNRSVVSNARPHCGQTHLLKVDIQDFFPSITLPRGVAIFRHLGYPRNVSYFLASLCFLESKLPQGSPSSPSIANIVARRMDSRILGLAQHLGLNYTRYADDMTFSGAYISPSFISSVTKIAVCEGFRLNDEKIRFSRKPGKRIVAGVSVSGSIVRLPRHKKREIRKIAFFLLKRGYDLHSEHVGYWDPILIERTLGQLAFWRQIEPESKTASALFDQLHEYSAQIGR